MARPRCGTPSMQQLPIATTGTDRVGAHRSRFRPGSTARRRLQKRARSLMSVPAWLSRATIYAQCGAELWKKRRTATQDRHWRVRVPLLARTVCAGALGPTGAVPTCFWATGPIPAGRTRGIDCSRPSRTSEKKCPFARATPSCALTNSPHKTWVTLWTTVGLSCRDHASC